MWNGATAHFAFEMMHVINSRTFPLCRTEAGDFGICHEELDAVAADNNKLPGAKDPNWWQTARLEGIWQLQAYYRYNFILLSSV